MRLSDEQWNETCQDPSCTHGRGAHLGSDGCGVPGCLCPGFIDKDPYGETGFYDTRRTVWHPRSTWDPHWWNKAGWPYFGDDEWGRKTIVVGFWFVGYFQVAWRTCWCQDCNRSRAETYDMYRELWACRPESGPTAYDDLFTNEDEAQGVQYS